MKATIYLSLPEFERDGLRSDAIVHECNYRLGKPLLRYIARRLSLVEPFHHGLGKSC